ncbi:MlaD family protein [Lutibaculum baratangense]|uniref:Mce/MlaD domain-containing protein n=1 Tax=Lutibaculum baratangense AMV1 TaxID=631454 RepID=V4RDJ9_9HYPH|nr:MlaD family protein [Lutibaculum baratangense]ESR24241.1 hypothetical protein N177_2690 [Lutibaculum baratangense AMV1]
METRANPLIVGLFTLVVIIAAFGFIVWMGSYGATRDRVTYQVVFPGEVTGLTEGSSVYYNGIRVGDVATLALDPDDPSKVIAAIRIRDTYPVTSNIRAQLQVQGVTGLAYVQLQPTDTPGEPLPPGATITGQRSNYQDILESGQSLLSKVDAIATKLNSILAQNENAVTATLSNVEMFTRALADNTDRVVSFMDDASSAARAFAELGGRIGTLSDSLNGIVEAINPQDVEEIVANARRFSASLADNSGRIDEIARNVGDATQRFSNLATELEGAGQQVSAVLAAVDPERVSSTLANIDTFSGQLAGAGQQLDALLTDVRGAAQRVDTVGGSVETLIAAVDQEKINATIANAETFSAALARNAAELDGLIVDARSTVQDFGAAGSRVAQLSDQVGAVVAAVDPERLSNTLANVDTFSGQLASAGQRLDGVLADAQSAASQIGTAGESVNTLVAAIDPARLANTVANAEAFTAALARQGPELDGLMADARAAAQGVNAATGTINEIVGAVDPAEVQSVMANVRQFTDVLAANSEKVTQLADAAVSAADRIDRVAAQIETIGGDVGAIVAAVEPDSVSRTLTNIESFSATLAGNTQEIDAFVASAREAADRIAAASEKVTAITDQAQQVVGAVDPEQVRAVMGDVRDFTGMLSSNRLVIESLLNNANSAAGEISSFAGRANEIATALDPTAIQRSITNVESFTVGLASKTEQVESFIDDASAVAAQLRETSQKLDGLLTQANDMLEGGGEGFITQATEAATAIRDTANNLNSRLDDITGDIRRYGTGGLRDFQQLMGRGQQTLQEVDRLIRRIEQNPAGFLTGGGSEVQDYNPGRRF